jgi:hypothetical protein
VKDKDIIDHYSMVVQTQKGIIEYAEAMAQVLAEAGRASNKALGDSEEYAVEKWCEVIKDRALQILRQDALKKDLRKRLTHGKSQGRG